MSATCPEPPQTTRRRALVPRRQAPFTVEEHVEVEATWGVYPRNIAAYRQPDRPQGRTHLQQVINSLARDVPAALGELGQLDSTFVSVHREQSEGRPAEPSAAVPDLPRVDQTRVSYTNGEMSFGQVMRRHEW
jgi:hypothetical protein